MGEDLAEVNKIFCVGMIKRFVCVFVSRRINEPQSGGPSMLGNFVGPLITVFYEVVDPEVDRTENALLQGPFRQLFGRELSFQWLRASCNWQAYLPWKLPRA